MISSKAIDEHLREVGGAHWITALPKPTLRRIIEQAPVQMTLFNDECLVEIPHPDHQEERLVICRNPLLAVERKRKRKVLLDVTEQKLTRLQERTKKTRSKLKGKDAIGIAIGKVIATQKMQKHFILDIQEDSFSFSRDEEKINQEAALDGLYAVRTDVPKEDLPDREVVWNYKLLSRVERAFRSMKAIDLRVRPIHHRDEKRVRTHMFICMLSYYVEWHLRKALAPILFQDETPMIRPRECVVTPNSRSEAAAKKASSKRTLEGLPVMSYRDALEMLESVVRAEVRLSENIVVHRTSEPKPVVKKMFELLNVKL